MKQKREDIGKYINKLHIHAWNLKNTITLLMLICCHCMWCRRWTRNVNQFPNKNTDNRTNCITPDNLVITIVITKLWKWCWKYAIFTRNFTGVITATCLDRIRQENGTNSKRFSVCFLQYWDHFQESEVCYINTIFSRFIATSFLNRIQQSKVISIDRFIYWIL